MNYYFYLYLCNMFILELYRQSGVPLYGNKKFFIKKSDIYF